MKRGAYMEKTDYKTIDEYVSKFPPEFQKRMERLREGRGPAAF